MDPDFAQHIDELSWTISTLAEDEIYEIERDGEPVAVLIHPSAYQMLLAELDDYARQARPVGHNEPSGGSNATH